MKPDLFAQPPAVIGVLHLAPLPGSPGAGASPSEITERALAEARIYVDAGVDALLVENHGDAPFHKDRVPPHVPALLARVARACRERFDRPVGINCLRNDGAAALGAAVAAEADFIRVNVLVGVTATDQGLVEGDAAGLLRYRAALGAEVAIWADVDVKFGTPLYRPPLRDHVKGLLTRGGASGVIVTGSATGVAPTPEEVADVRDAAAGRGPVLVGSGVSAENLPRLGRGVDGLIVGSTFKEDGAVERPVAPTRVEAFMAAVGRVREAGGSSGATSR